MTDFKIEEGTADFRLIDNKILKHICDHGEAELFLRGMIPYLGYKQSCVEYTPESVDELASNDFIVSNGLNDKDLQNFLSSRPHLWIEKCPILKILKIL